MIKLLVVGLGCYYFGTLVGESKAKTGGAELYHLYTLFKRDGQALLNNLISWNS